MGEQLATKELQIGVKVVPHVGSKATFQKRIDEAIEGKTYDVPLSIDATALGKTIQRKWTSVRTYLGGSLSIPVDVDFSKTAKGVSSNLRTAVEAGVQSGLDYFATTDFSNFQKKIHAILALESKMLDQQKQNTPTPQPNNKLTSKKKLDNYQKQIDNLSTAISAFESNYNTLLLKLQSGGLDSAERNLRDIVATTDNLVNSLSTAYEKLADTFQVAHNLADMKPVQVKLINATLDEAASDALVGSKKTTKKKSSGDNVKKDSESSAPIISAEQFATLSKNITDALKPLSELIKFLQLASGTGAKSDTGKPKAGTTKKSGTKKESADSNTALASSIKELSSSIQTLSSNVGNPQESIAISNVSEFVTAFNDAFATHYDTLSQSVNNDKQHASSDVFDRLNILSREIQNIKSDLIDVDNELHDDKPILTDAQVGALCSAFETILTPIRDLTVELKQYVSMQGAPEQTPVQRTADTENAVEVRAIQEISELSTKAQQALADFATKYENKPVLTDMQVSLLSSDLQKVLEPVGKLATSMQTYINSSKHTRKTSARNTNTGADNDQKLNGALRTLAQSINNLKAAVAGINVDTVTVKNPDDIKTDLKPVLQKCDAIIKTIPGSPFSVKLEPAVTNNLSTLFTAVQKISQATAAIQGHCKTGTFKVSGISGDGGGNNKPPSPKAENKRFVNAQRRSYDTIMRKYANKSRVDMDQYSSAEKSANEAELRNKSQAILNEMQTLSNATTAITDAAKKQLEDLINELRDLVQRFADETRGGFTTRKQADNLKSSHRRSVRDKDAMVKELTDLRDVAIKNNFDQALIDELSGYINDLENDANQLNTAFNTIIDANGHLVNTTYAAKESYEQFNSTLADTLEMTRDLIDLWKQNPAYQNMPTVSSDDKLKQAQNQADASFLSSANSSFRRTKAILTDRTKIDWTQVSTQDANSYQSRIDNAEIAFRDKLDEARQVQGQLGEALIEELNALLNKYIQEVEIARKATTGGFEKNTDTAAKVTRTSGKSIDKASKMRDLLIRERDRLMDDEGADAADIQYLIDQIDALEKKIREFEAIRDKVVDTTNNHVLDTSHKSKAAYDAEKKSLDELSKAADDYYDNLTGIHKKFAMVKDFIVEYEAKPGFKDDPTATSLMNQMRSIVAPDTHYYDLTADELEKLISLVGRYKQATEGIRKANNDTAVGSTKTAGKIADLAHKIKQYIDTNTKLKKDPALYNSFMQLYEATKDGTQNFTQLNTKFKEYQREAQAAGLESDSLFVKMKKLFYTHFSSGIAVEAVQFLRRGFTEVFQAVKLVDDQMTELKKVTDLSDTGYKEYLSDAADQAKRLGSTLDAVIESSATWARLGYDMSDVGYLSEAATVYVNVADGLESATEGTETLISTMKAFNVEAKNAIDVVDALNITGNTAAISSAGLGQALTRSSAALSAANNSLEESIGLITAGM